MIGPSTITLNLQGDTVVAPQALKTQTDCGQPAGLYPSARIPPELITEIFLHCATQCWSAFSVHFDAKPTAVPESEMDSDSDSDEPSLPAIPPIDGWIQLLHICHRWREIALFSPQLWGHAILNFPAMTRLCITRSCGVPLHVWRFGTGAFSTQEQGAFGLVIHQLSRVQELYIKAPELVMPSLPKEVLKHISAPLLKVCVFRGAQYPELLDIMLGHGLPRLEHLEIPAGYVRTWCMFPLPSTLKSLEVSESFKDPSTFKSRGSQTLPPQDDSTNLKSLIIKDHSFSTHDSLPRITFHQLEYLDIFTMDCDRLLQYIRSFNLPPVPKIRLHAYYWPPIKEILDSCHCPPLRSVTVFSVLPFQVFLFNAWSEVHPVSQLEDDSVSAMIKVRCADAPINLGTPEDLAHIFRNVETLSLSAPIDVRLGSLRVLSEHASNVRNLGLDCITAGMLLGGGGGEGKSIWELFPNLHCLTLRGDEWGAGILDLVLGCLQAKADTGAKLRRLEIDCSIWDSQCMDSERFDALVDEIGVVLA